MRHLVRFSRRHHRLSRAESHVRRGPDELLQRERRLLARCGGGVGLIEGRVALPLRVAKRSQVRAYPLRTRLPDAQPSADRANRGHPPGRYLTRERLSSLPAPVRLAGSVRALPVAEANRRPRRAHPVETAAAHIENQLLPARLGSPHRPADVGRCRSGSQVRYLGELLLMRQTVPSWQQVGRMRADARVQAGTSEAADALT